ncbi:MAG: tetratricopeptide repeat protein [Mariprofundus sp.]
MNMRGLILLLVMLLSTQVIAAGMYEQARSDLSAGRVESALASLARMLKDKPEDYHAWFLFGVAHARKQSYHQAIEAFRRVIELNPALAEPHNNLAVIYNELGDVHAAVRELEQSLAKRPGYAVAEENIADLYVKLALLNYRSALEKQPNAQLEQRYNRLLQVRLPHGATTARDAGEKGDENTDQHRIKRTRQAAETEQSEDTPAEVSTSAYIDPLPQKLAAVDARDDQTDFAGGGETVTPEQAILAAVEAWRAAWQGKHLEHYFSAYAADFIVPSRFASLTAWQAYKRRVITSKSYIRVEINDIRVQMEKGSEAARVEFFQKFRSNSYNGDDMKSLIMKREQGAWKIVREETAS